jgi:hypothetical protein
MPTTGQSRILRRMGRVLIPNYGIGCGIEKRSNPPTPKLLQED